MGARHVDRAGTAFAVMLNDVGMLSLTGVTLNSRDTYWREKTMCAVIGE